jgi:hypothetical protein
LVCGNSILDGRLSLNALKGARQFLVYFAEQSAKLAFELPVPSRVEARFGNEKLSILIPLFDNPVEFAETKERLLRGRRGRNNVANLERPRPDFPFDDRQEQLIFAFEVGVERAS